MRQHNSRLREELITVHILFSLPTLRFCSRSFSLPFLALSMETYNFFFLLPLYKTFINSWHNSFFFILANGTLNELFLLLNLNINKKYLKTQKLWLKLWLRTFVFWEFQAKINFHPSRAEIKKRKLFDSCEFTTYFVSCWNWTETCCALFFAVCSSLRSRVETCSWKKKFNKLSHVLEIVKERNSWVCCFLKNVHLFVFKT